jgi:hypothetical protein
MTQVISAEGPSFSEKSVCADSFLTWVSNDEFQQGMAALRTSRDAINQSDAVTEDIDWLRLDLHNRCGTWRNTEAFRVRTILPSWTPDTVEVIRFAGSDE